MKIKPKIFTKEEQELQHMYTVQGCSSGYERRDLFLDKLFFPAKSPEVNERAFFSAHGLHVFCSYINRVGAFFYVPYGYKPQPELLSAWEARMRLRGNWSDKCVKAVYKAKCFSPFTSNGLMSPVLLYIPPSYGFRIHNRNN